jgi:type III secretory pathway component EscT
VHTSAPASDGFKDDDRWHCHGVTAVTAGEWMKLEVLLCGNALPSRCTFLPLLSREAGGLLLSLLDTIVSTGLMLVGPVVVCLLLVDLLFGFIAGAAPSLQPFYLSMTVKNLVFSLVLVLYSAFMVGYMKNGLVVFLDVKPQLEAIAPR